MPTLFELAKRWFDSRLTKSQIFNPLNAEIGAIFRLDVLDYRDKHFSLKGIDEYRRKQVIEGQTPTISNWVDYVIGCRPINSEPIDVRVRFHPDHHDIALLLTKEDEVSFDPGLDSSIRTGSFQIFDGQILVAEYARLVAGVKEPYAIEVVGIDAAIDGTRRHAIELSDYRREYQDDADQKCIEYFFVEKDLATGMFRMYKGTEIGTRQVIVL